MKSDQQPCGRPQRGCSHTGGCRMCSAVQSHAGDTGAGLVTLGRSMLGWASGLFPVCATSSELSPG